MPRNIKQDTKIIKVDLERLVKVGEAMVKDHEDDLSGGLKDLLKFSAYLFDIYDEYKQLKKEIASDTSLASDTDKKKYFGQTILEGANCLGKIIIEKYVR